MPTPDRALLIEILTNMSHEAEQIESGLQQRPDVSGVEMALRQIPNHVSFTAETLGFAHKLVQRLAESTGVTRFEVLQQMARE